MLVAAQAILLFSRKQNRSQRSSSLFTQLFLFLSPDVVFFWGGGREGESLFQTCRAQAANETLGKTPDGGTHMLLCNLSQICSGKQAGGKHPPAPFKQKIRQNIWTE